MQYLQAHTYVLLLVCVFVGLAETIYAPYIQIIPAVKTVYTYIRHIYTVLANPMYLCAGVRE